MEYRVRSLSPQRKTLSGYFAPRLCLGRLIQGGRNVDSTCEIWWILAFVLEALLVGLVGKPMVLELGRHTAFTPFPWWWPGAKSLAEILSDRREHNTKPRWCSSMCREMHCLRLPPHNIDTCTYQCRWIWYQFCSTICIQCNNCDDNERCSRSDFGQSVTWLTPSLTQQAGTSCTKLTGGL